MSHWKVVFTPHGQRGRGALKGETSMPEEVKGSAWKVPGGGAEGTFSIGAESAEEHSRWTKEGKGGYEKHA